MAALLSDDDIASALADLPGWTHEDDSIVRSIEADSFAEGIALVDEVAVVADARNHHPDIDIRWTTVTFRLSSHSDGGLTGKDMEMAASINRLVS